MTELPRRLDLSGVTNFRDLGGYATADGRRLRWRRLFRSSHLGALADGDRATLDTLGITTICDFRGVDEAALRPSALGGAEVVPLSIEPSVVPQLQRLVASGEPVTGAAVLAMMQATYRAYVRDHAGRYAELFRQLLKGGPLVFHCSAGKDRTGVGAALTLSALGVDRDTIVADYLLTNQYWREDGSNARALPEEAMAVLGRVDERLLAAAFAAIEADHGSVDGFLAAIGVGPAERARLAELYLEG